MGRHRGAHASLVALALVACGGGGATPDAAVSPDALAAPVDAFAAAPALSLDPPSAALGTALVGEASAPVEFTLANRGDAPATMLTVTLGGRDAGEFQIQTHACPTELAVGASCVLSVWFVPLSAVDAQASLDARALGASVSAPLSGRGQSATELSIVPTPFDFGLASAPTPAHTFVVTHGSVGGTLAMSLGGTDASDFAIVRDACSGVLGASPTCEVDVVFAPTANGARSAQLSATATPGGTASAALSGMGEGF